jgi:hypothetical protein
VTFFNWPGINMLEHLFYFGEVSYSSAENVVPSLKSFTHSLTMGLTTAMLSFMYPKFVPTAKLSSFCTNRLEQ